MPRIILLAVAGPLGRDGGDSSTAPLTRLRSEWQRSYLSAWRRSGHHRGASRKNGWT